MNSELRVLVIHTEEAFVAQCLEHDISVQADDLSSLQKRFEDAVAFEAQLGDGIDAIPAAPAHFFNLWDRARELGGAPKNTEMRLAA